MKTCTRGAVKSPRLPSRDELDLMSHAARFIVLRAYVQTLHAERAGLDTGFRWNQSISLSVAKRSVKDRLRAAEQRAKEFSIDISHTKLKPDLTLLMRGIKERYSSAA